MNDVGENTSEVPQDTESFRAIPQDAEPYGSIPHDSVPFRTVPYTSETVRNIPHRSERTEHHTLTVRDAARMFEQADVARTERSITNWCQPDKHGVSRLDCSYDQNEYRWFITRQSVERAIEEEQAKAGSEHGQRLSEAPADIPKRTEAPQEPAKEGASVTHHERKIAELEAAVRDLSIASGVKDLYIKRVEKENERLQEHVQQHVDHLIKLNRHAGRLEGMLGLPSPQRHDETSEEQRSEEAHDDAPKGQHRTERQATPDEPVTIPVRSLSDADDAAAYEDTSNPNPHPFHYD